MRIHYCDSEPRDRIGPDRVQVGRDTPYANRRVLNTRWPRVSVLIFMHIMVFNIYIIITIYTVHDAFHSICQARYRIRQYRYVPSRRCYAVILQFEP